jgi:hypothetical protein
MVMAKKKVGFQIFSNLILFYVFFGICLGLGYATVNRYDLRDTGVRDSRAYFEMADFSYAEMSPPYRYRVLTPSLAGVIQKGLSYVPLGTWSKVAFSFLIVNSFFMALAACILGRIALLVTGDQFVSILAPFVYLTAWPVVNLHLCGLVEAGEAFFFVTLIYLTLRNSWWATPIVICIGILAKETLAVFGIFYLIAYYVFQRIVEKRESSAPIIFIVINVLVAAATIQLVRTLIGGEVLQSRELSLNLDLVLRTPLGIFECISSHQLIYGLFVLLPIGLMGLKHIPRVFVVSSFLTGLFALVCGGYAHVGGSVDRSLFNVLGPVLAIAGAVFLVRVCQYVGGIARPNSLQDLPKNADNKNVKFREIQTDSVSRLHKKVER